MSSGLRCFTKSNDFTPLKEWITKHQLLTCTSMDKDKECDIINTIFPSLSTKQLGHLILYKETIDSTQNVLHTTLMDAPNGTICLADIQNSGKGRGSNTWTSPMGCLMFSFKSTYIRGEQLPFVQYLVSLALIQSIQKLANQTDFNIKIKWPNDIYGNDMKIGGILCQSEYRNNVFEVTTGVGINLSNKEPTTCINDIVGNPTITRENLLTTFCNIYEPMIQQFNEKGFEPFEKDYLHNWMHTNQNVVIEGDSSKGENPINVVIKGLTTTGCLKSLGEDGKSYELYPDSNSFDFFKGLLKRAM